MPRELSLFSIYLPTLLPLLLAVMVILWSVDGLLARMGFYQYVWHPSLFRLSLLIATYSLLGLWFYQ